MDKRILILGIFIMLFLICCVRQSRTVSEENITKDDALKIAEQICQQENWAWVDVSITENDNYWDIMTNSSQLGMNGFIRIDNRTGDVIKKEMTGP